MAFACMLDMALHGPTPETPVGLTRWAVLDIWPAGGPPKYVLSSLDMLFMHAGYVFLYQQSHAQQPVWGRFMHCHASCRHGRRGLPVTLAAARRGRGQSPWNDGLEEDLRHDLRVAAVPMPELEAGEPTPLQGNKTETRARGRRCAFAIGTRPPTAAASAARARAQWGGGGGEGRA
jgi:hypothetical protein